MTDQIEKPRKIDGRSKEARALREAARLAAGNEQSLPAEPVEAVRATPRVLSRKQPRTVEKEPARSAVRSGVAIGRDGQVLTRSRVSNIDPFTIPPEIVPEGWEYQWNAISVVGDKDVVLDQNNRMYENGWRPVPADRHRGRFVSMGTRGDIIRGGQRLEERPKVLSDEARAEDYRAAVAQMRDRDQSLMGGRANLRQNMPDGFAMNRGRYRGTGADLKMSIDPAVDAPTPKYDIAED